ncbi:MAG: TIGR01777 family protein [Elusimicrobia bacterium]|nr:TIGR01777 family protein [Elusimicrobiota bacterium]
MKTVVAGATGFIGRALCESLAQAGHEVVAIARRSMGGPRPFKTVFWDGAADGDWTQALDGADAVVNLCGASVASRWTESRKRVLMESRILTTRAIVEAVAAARKRPEAFVNASAAGYYGDAADADCTEESPKGTGFLAGLCAAWEAEASHAARLGVRTVLLRMGVVLAADGGALPMMSLPFWLRVGGPLGSGRQWIPWITRDDLVRAAAFVLHSRLSGPVNAAGPCPSTNRDFSKAIGRALERPCWLRTPGIVLRLALGEMADMLLTGQKAVPAKLLEAGFRFEHADVDAALKGIFR